MKHKCRIIGIQNDRLFYLCPKCQVVMACESVSGVYYECSGCRHEEEYISYAQLADVVDNMMPCNDCTYEN